MQQNSVFPGVSENSSSRWWGSVRSGDALFCVGSHTKLSHVGETMDTSTQLWALVLVGQPRVHSWDLILPLTLLFFFLLAGHNVVPSVCFHLTSNFL